MNTLRNSFRVAAVAGLGPYDLDRRAERAEALGERVGTAAPRREPACPARGQAPVPSARRRRTPRRRRSTISATSTFR